MSNFFKSLFNISNKVRIVLTNLIFWVILLLVVYYATRGVEEGTKGETLLIQPGIISDTVGEEELITLFMSGADELPYYTLLDDIIFAITNAANDSDITDIILDLDALSSVGYASAEEIGKAIDYFKKSGKMVYAFSAFYNQSQYYLASFADEISMDPYGEFSIDGIGVYRNYWKNLLDKYSIDVSVFRAGEYKSYVEPYISNVMSNEVKEQNLTWMNSLWSGFMDDINKNRDVNTNTMAQYFSNRVELLKSYNGDNAKFSKSEGFIDNLETRLEFFNKFYDFYNLSDYVVDNRVFSGKKSVGILNIEGTITYGDNNPGSVSAVEIEGILDDFIFNANDWDGLIIRINSGGGGVFASEIIRRKVSEVSEYMPVIISMGDVCASGGYWIATAGDKIYADSRTITGSIGVFGMVYGLEDTLENFLGVNNDGVSTTPYAEKSSLTKNISDESADIFQLSVDNTYNQFTTLVSESRGLDIDEVKEIAGGRVWSGIQGVKHGLVDTIGGLEQAKLYFKENFGTSDIQFNKLEGETSIFEQIYTEVTNINFLPPLKAVEEVKVFDRINDPKNIYAMWY